MTIKELKEIIAELPDEAQVYVEICHTEYDWKDCSTDKVEAVYYEDCERLDIEATVKDK